MARSILSNPRFHLNRKVNLGFALTLALLVAIGIISYRNMSALVQTVHWEVHTHEVLNQLDDLLLQIQNAETGQRGYIITGEQRYLQPYDTALVGIHEELAQLRRLCADNPRQQRRLDALEPLIAKKLNELKQTIVLRSQQGFEAAWRVIQTDRGQQLMDDIRGWLEAMEAEEKELLYGRERSAESSTRRAIASITFSTLLNFAFVIAVVVAIHCDLERREQAAAAIRKAYGVLEERVRERTAELARANQDLQSKIGEAQQAEQRLKESRDHMLSVLDRLRLGTVKTDRAGAIIFLSRAAKRLLGKASEEALGIHWEKPCRCGLRTRFNSRPSS